MESEVPRSRDGSEDPRRQDRANLAADQAVRQVLLHGMEGNRRQFVHAKRGADEQDPRFL